MYWKLLDFGGVSPATTLLLILAMLWIGIFWWYQLREVDRIRNAIAKSNSSKQAMEPGIV